MSGGSERLAWVVQVASAPAETVERVTGLLAEQGFGVLTRIDAHEVFKKKLGVEREPYIILGACNPAFAKGAIDAAPAIGVLLPCNVIVEGVPGGSKVYVTRPETLFELVRQSDLASVVEGVSSRLAAVVTALGGSPG